MKTDIHPEYNQIKVSCSCGHTFSTHSTRKEDIQLDICSNCHPQYTGKQKTVQTNRVKQFQERYGSKD